MIVVSNHLIQRKIIRVTNSMTVRVNLAWVKNKGELKKYLAVPYEIFLDYPHGRLKAPASKFNVLESIDIANTFKNITHYAMSNAEETDMLLMLRKLIRADVVIVPKIETCKGVENLENIIGAARTRVVMLDKEDLAVSTGDRKAYAVAVENVRYYCKNNRIKILELAGVIFSS
jgi:pyruvate kinase